MNQYNENEDESKKHAIITPEQEALLRAFKQAKKMGYGEFTIFIQGGNIVRYEFKKSKSFFHSKKSSESRQGHEEYNVKNIEEATEDMKNIEEATGDAKNTNSWNKGIIY